MSAENATRESHAKRDVVAAMARHATGVLAGIATVAAVARGAGAAGLGVWALLGSVTALVALLDLGLSVTVQRAVLRADGGARAREAGSHALAVLATVGPLVALASGAWVYSVARASGTGRAAELTLAVALSLVGAMASAWVAPSRAFCVAHGAVATLARVRVLSASAQVLFAAAGFAHGWVLAFVSAGALVSALIELTGVGLCARAIDPRWPLVPARVERALLGSLLREASAPLAVNVTVLLLVRADVAVLASTATLATVGAYNLAVRATDQAFTVVKQGSTALMPRLGARESRDAALRDGTALLGVLAASGLAAIAWCAQPLLRAWAGPTAMHPAVAPALVLSGLAAVLVSLAEMPSSSLTFAAKNPWQGAVPHITGCAVNLVVTLAGARSYGVWAVAGGTIVGNAITLALLWRGAARQQRWSARDVLRAMAPAAAALVVASLVGVSLAHFAAAGLLRAVFASMLVTTAGTLVGALTYVALGAPRAGRFGALLRRPRRGARALVAAGSSGAAGSVAVTEVRS